MNFTREEIKQTEAKDTNFTNLREVSISSQLAATETVSSSLLLLQLFSCPRLTAH